MTTEEINKKLIAVLCEINDGLYLREGIFLYKLLESHGLEPNYKKFNDFVGGNEMKGVNEIIPMPIFRNHKIETLHEVHQMD